MIPIFSLLLLLFLLPTTNASTRIGITYIPSPSSPSPEHVASFLHEHHHISAVHLPNPTPSTIRAFTYFPNISLLLSLPNSLIPSFASNSSSSLSFLHSHLLPFYPRAHITSISLGNDAVLSSPADLTPLLLPALQNLHQNLHSLGLNSIQISTTFSFVSVLENPFPPSSASFQEPLNTLIVTPVLNFLSQTNSSFFVNLHPYKLYKLSPQIPVAFPLFLPHPYNFRDDLVTNVRYRNLFDMMVDAVIAAMAVAGHEDIPVVVAETGWPSYASGSEVEAGGRYSELYLRGLVRHLSSEAGTPLRREGVAMTYVYQLFDTNNWTSTSSGGNGDGDVGLVGEEKWGIMYANNMSMKYKVDFSKGSSGRIGREWILGVMIDACLFAVVIFLM